MKVPIARLLAANGNTRGPRPPEESEEKDLDYVFVLPNQAPDT